MAEPNIVLFPSLWPGYSEKPCTQSGKEYNSEIVYPMSFHFAVHPLEANPGGRRRVNIRGMNTNQLCPRTQAKTRLLMVYIVGPKCRGWGHTTKSVPKDQIVQVGQYYLSSLNEV